MVEEFSVAEVNGMVKKQFGSAFLQDFVFYCKQGKDGVKVFIYSGSSAPNVKAEWIGLHVGTVDSAGFAPTIEGAQLLGAKATKGVVSLTSDEALALMSGEDLAKKTGFEGYVLLEVDGVFLGAGLSQHDKIISLTPASRRTRKL
ncbi:MAG: hypothetical protein ABH834_02990 [Candidatus Altiarchaeota archaeon]